MKISQRFTHPQGILFQMNTFGVIFHIVLSVPICIIAVNGAPVSKSPQKVSNHHKTTPHGSGVLIKDFWSETMR